MSDVRIEPVPGDALDAASLEAVARLRIAVFRDWPYLYDGNLAYETRYLATYTRSQRSVFVLARDGDAIVGASTGLPLADEEPVFRAPFEAHGPAVDDVFYCGESVLLPAWRGRGIGHAFFDAREAHARALGLGWTAFAAVDRDPSDPRRPEGHRGHEAFWSARGYVRRPGLTMRLAWKEHGDAVETDKPLTFWLRPLEARR